MTKTLSEELKTVNNITYPPLPQMYMYMYVSIQYMKRKKSLPVAKNVAEGNIQCV